MSRYPPYFELEVGLPKTSNLQGLNARITKAVDMAQKDAARHLASVTAKYIASEYWLKKGFIRHHIRPQSGGIRIASPRLGLEHYKFSPRAGSPTRKRLKAAVRRGHGVQSLGNKAFMWSHAGFIPFARYDAGKFPVHRLLGPAVPQLVDNPGVIENIQQEGAETFQKRFQHYISRLGGSA